jgi:hypothetical protein
MLWPVFRFARRPRSAPPRPLPDVDDAPAEPGTCRPAPTPLRPRGHVKPPLVFRRGAHPPYATRWFGVTSLVGHARNLVASAIAAESIDSRDWMHPGAAHELLSHVVRILGGDPSQVTLAQAMGRTVWFDFVADTGDDRDVSQAVARLLFATYEVDSGGKPRRLPRGDVLVFGGDTAYPVATGEEIARRVVAPWNEVLREQDDVDPARRVILGIPGNHDWYDGLDGFGRLFRRRAKGSPPSVDAPPSGRNGRAQGPTGVVARQLHLDEVGGAVTIMTDALSAIRAVWSGTKIHRPRRLELVGYEAVQDASYWALPLAPCLEAWGVDRQLGRLDFRQRLFFEERRRESPRGGILFIAPEPAIAFGEEHESGTRMLSACRLSLESDRVFYLTGDLHHYERRPIGTTSLHVVAGGGGAFLHGTRISPPPGKPPASVWPSAATSRQLVAQVPWKLMLGSAGFILHIAFAALAAFELAASARSTTALVIVACAVAAALAAALYASVGRNQARPQLVAAFAVLFGGASGLLPMALRLGLPHIVPTLAVDVGTLVVCAFLGPLWIGVVLATVTTLGLEHQQAFSVLSHPGFKHFVKMCVHLDGRIEGWVIGKDDPLGSGEPTLVDRFDWEPQQRQ